MAGLAHKIKQKLLERCNKTKYADESSQMAKIEALLVITAAILVFLGVSGSFRRRCGSEAFAKVAFAAYTLTPAVIAYTLGLIQTAPFCKLRLPVWATYLVAVLGNVDSYTAHRMEDIERWKSFKVDSAAKCIMISWMIASYVVLSGPKMCILFVVLLMKVDERARALMLASNSMMQEKCRFVADYMSNEHLQSGSSDEDPATMRGYRYLVRAAEETTTAKWRPKAAPWLDGDAPHYRQLLVVTDEVITVEQVWNCKGRLLSASGGDRDGRLKDLCLSFSLFKFICLRFTGYTLPPQAHDKLRRLIWHMLSEENGGYERVFRVIEVELAFLFDLFYTKYPVNLHQRYMVYRFLLLPILIFLPPLLFLLIALWAQNVLVVVQYVLLMVSILVVKLTQFGIMIFSEWAKVTYICKYVRNERWQMNCVGKLIEIMCRVWLVKPWGRQLRQYSLLESYSYSPWKFMYNRFTAAYLNRKRKGQKQIAPTMLSEQVKKAVAQSLGYCTGPTGYLEKGQASLRLNGLLDGLSWACHLETTTHVIMVWHIATTFCEHECAQLPQEQRDNFSVATNLSQYLAYLVVFAPRLLPGHPCRTEYIFDRAVGEARKLFGGSPASVEERIQKLNAVINDQQCRETVVGRGARLGIQLVNQVADKERIWKVLADFWAEMVLYVAPSNDTAAHAKYLTTGGEFLTHVWVLVSHAGITRDPRDGEH